MDSLRLHPEIQFEWVGPQQKIPACDLIIIPGSKNVQADLQFLCEQQWDQDLKHHLRYGGKVIGICGGMQMLGNKILDPDCIESNLGSSQGLGFLDIETTLTTHKILRQQQGLLWDKSTSVSGYEIHCGISQGNGLKNPALYFNIENQLVADGAISDDGQVLGTYLHGLFDTSESCKKILHWAGIDLTAAINIDEQREHELNRLTSVVESALNLDSLRF